MAVYEIEIYDPNYSSVIFTIQGTAKITRPRVKTMDMLRGSSLNMQLEADTDSTYQEPLYSTVGDKQLPVLVTKDGIDFWNGWIKPDGIVESFVTDFWLINIQAVDGLGLLENIKFLNPDGDIYQGSMSELDILQRCIELTGATMNYRIYDLNMYFSVDDTDPVITQQALFDTYVNTDRYVKDDKKGSVFTVKEVLESLLKKYGCFITQQENKWHIVRIIDYYTDATSISFSEYDSDGVFISYGAVDPRTTLGSDIDGYNPCHAGANQQKNYNAALGGFKAYYEYGIVNSVLENPKMYFNDGVGDIDGWTVYDHATDWDFVLKDAIPGWASGYYEGQMLPQNSSTTDKTIEYDHTTYDNDLDLDATLKIKIEAFVNLDVGGLACVYGQKIRVTFIGDSGTPYYLNDTGEWTISVANIQLYKYNWSVGRRTREMNFTTDISANGLPEDGTITLIFYRPYYDDTDYGSYTVIKNISIAGVQLGVKGESWTATKTDEVSAVVDVESKVFVCDNDGDSYIGAIEDSAANNTVQWAKAISGVIDDTKMFPLLNWLARDRMQISGGNSMIFRGGILGYLPYLGVLTINNIDGNFQCLSYTHDLKTDRIEAEFERVFDDDIYDDLSLTFALESENIVRPAIE